MEAAGGEARFLAQPALSLLPAARVRRLAWLGSLYLLGWGPRAPHAARDLAAALHAPVPAQADRGCPGEAGVRSCCQTRGSRP